MMTNFIFHLLFHARMNTFKILKTITYTIYIYIYAITSMPSISLALAYFSLLASLELKVLRLKVKLMGK